MSERQTHRFHIRFTPDADPKIVVERPIRHDGRTLMFEGAVRTDQPGLMLYLPRRNDAHDIWTPTYPDKPPRGVTADDDLDYAGARSIPVPGPAFELDDGSGTVWAVPPKIVGQLVTLGIGAELPICLVKDSPYDPATRPILVAAWDGEALTVTDAAGNFGIAIPTPPSS